MRGVTGQAPFSTAPLPHFQYSPYYPLCSLWPLWCKLFQIADEDVRAPWIKPPSESFGDTGDGDFHVLVLEPAVARLDDPFGIDKDGTVGCLA